MAVTVHSGPGLFRRVGGIAACCAVFGSLVWQAGRTLEHGPGWIPVDFMAFWTAAKLHTQGRNAYDQAAVHELQTSQVDGVGEAVMMWNPPWTLTLVAPFAGLPVPTAASAWLLVLLVLLVVAVDLLWRVYGGPRKWAPAVWFGAILFAPTIHLFAYGQLTPIPLLGIAGFLFFVKRRQFFLAGVLGGLAAAKPNLLALFALGIVLEAVRCREGRAVLFGGLCLGAITSGSLCLHNPNIFTDYITAMAGSGSDLHRSVGEWKPPLVGWYLREIVPGKPFAVQCLPLALAAIGFSVCWWRNRKDWDWLAAMPWVVGVSLLVAPYGAWAHDGIMLLVPVLAVAARLDPQSRPARAGVVLFLIANVAGYVAYLMHAFGETYVWMTPTVLLACRLARRAPPPTIRPTHAGVKPLLQTSLR